MHYQNINTKKYGKEVIVILQDSKYCIKNEIHWAYFIPGYNAMRH